MKKLFIKLAKILGFEIIDQNNFSSPTLNKELNEDLMLGAVLFGHQEMKAVINACNELKQKVGNEDWVVEKDEDASDYYTKIESKHKDKITEAFKISNKSDRNEALSVIKNQIVDASMSMKEVLHFVA